MTEKLDARALGRSLNGFDEIAIRKMFGDTFEKLEGMFAGRALYFIHLRREGQADGDAYKGSMNATVGELEELFGSEDAEGNDGGSTTPTTDTTQPIEPSPTSSSAAGSRTPLTSI